MRKELRKFKELRLTFEATVDRFGEKSSWKGTTKKTLLLKNIKLEGVQVTDHLWMNCGSGFDKLRLKSGDIIQFDARVSQYLKGYFGYREDVYKESELDYGLSYPTKVVRKTPS